MIFTHVASPGKKEGGVDGWGLVCLVSMQEREIEEHMVPFLEAAHPPHLSHHPGKDSGCWESEKYQHY